MIASISSAFSRPFRKSGFLSITIKLYLKSNGTRKYQKPKPVERPFFRLKSCFCLLKAIDFEERTIFRTKGS